MRFELIPFTVAPGIVHKQAVGEVIKCNDYTAGFGLTLTPAQAAELVETRFIALSENGRIEFGGGVIDKIIKEFCDSPFISMHNYTQTIHELLEIFYYYKNETLDLLSDDELIKYMKTSYDGICQGSLDLLSGRELDRLARNLRAGYRYDYQDNTFSGGGFAGSDYPDGTFSEDEIPDDEVIYDE